MEKRYEAKQFEEKIYKLWKESEFFNPDKLPGKRKKKYSITIPPPNITGSLHMGHALNNTVQDILIRYHRMIGCKTLWLPGTDHAGIATQNVVEKKLKKEGLTRHQLGREEFTKTVWQWKEKYGNLILEQLEKLGCSCDWSRLRFTLDKQYEQAVLTAFTNYHKKGYIYRGPRIVNWCPRCETAISDIEIKYKESLGKLWYIKYPLKDNPKKFITVATTRPETMLGDTAIAVNPRDEKYKNLIGQKVILPIVGREIPIVSHYLVKTKFGTGAVKITPAHDKTDWQIGKANTLPIINVIGPDGKMTKEAGKYAGLSTKETRTQIIAELEKLNLLEKTEDYKHQVSLCDRCGTPIEPQISTQWFVKMKKLAKPAIKAVKNGKIKIVPERFKKVYLDWLNNIDDWCISRQLWWGHRIPAWHKGNKTLIPNKVTKLVVTRHGLTDWDKQDKTQGQTDVPIDENQIEEIKKFAQKIKNENFAAIICSPLMRAKQTAKIIANKLNIPVVIEELIIERDYGEFEGKTSKEIKKEHPDYHKNKFNYDIPGDSEESYENMNKRAEKFMQKMDHNYNNQKVLIITHNAYMRALRKLIHGGDPKELSNYKPLFGQLERYQILDGNYNLKGWQQSKDVLDTWFSSALWPFATLGWPEKTKDLKEYYPTSMLSTARDILYLWVARMVFSGFEFMKKIPFQNVYIHGTILTLGGKRMSKSLGTGVDPLEFINEYGSDATRLGIILQANRDQQEIRFDPRAILAARNFINKLWNISRFVEFINQEIPRGKITKPTGADQWILSRVNSLGGSIAQQIENNELSLAAKDLYEFVWHDFADWYIEIAKFQKENFKLQKQTSKILRMVLEKCLKMLHPFIPFVTETINIQLNKIGDKEFFDLLIVAQWPQTDKKMINIQIEKEFEGIKDIVTEIRKWRKDEKIKPREIITLPNIFKNKLLKLKPEYQKIVKQLAKIK